MSAIESKHFNVKKNSKNVKKKNSNRFESRQPSNAGNEEGIRASFIRQDHWLFHFTKMRKD